MTETNNRDTATLRALVDEYCRVLSMGAAPFDRSKAEYLYRLNDDFTAYDLQPPNEGYPNWQSYAAAWNKIMEKYAHFEMRLYDDVRVFSRGDVAWTCASFNVVVSLKTGETLSKDGRFSLVWTRDNEVWTIAHEHVSSPRVSTDYPPPA